MKHVDGQFRLLLDTIPVVHEIDPTCGCCARTARWCWSACRHVPAFHSRLLIGGRKTLSGSAIGGIAETQELLDFCAEKGIVADCEMTSMPADQRGLRAHGEGRRAVPLRHRHADAVDTRHLTAGGERDLIVSTTLTGSNADIIGDAIASVLEQVDRCLVIDTGAKDDSIDVARRVAGDKLLVREFPWQNDFSAARNFALEAATEAGAPGR